MKKFLILLLLSFSLPTIAKRQFDIEIVIFKRIIDVKNTGESWPNTLPKINLNHARSFEDKEYQIKKGIKILPSAEYKLTDKSLQSLKEHQDFEILLHKAWRQNDDNREYSPIFHIQAGKNYSKELNQDIITNKENISQPIYELNGKLQIYVQHYLYLEIELNLNKLHTVNQKIDLSFFNPNFKDKNKQFIKSYRMNQKRQIRSSETHYLDHPLMGIIIQINRVNEEE
ncbi:peptidoglycan binding protein CsiV [Candidatus Photodesmus anomalopis]|uniref:Peptidoglycan-binding protein CsiV n=1 Tax=Candidatus Photodesmus katoptron Akat1 TaxID=1236703 RepID=S3DHB3_9GAMM|nr:peptidoglycan binding protein CsiV [Candidatus Photodesmus katoptron]EPE37812.1 hypothetical protein O1U_0274 [Candidatus Photodesmus katoptron Akat1]